MGVTALEHPPLWTIGLSALLIALEPAMEREMRALRAIASAGRLITMGFGSSLNLPLWRRLGSFVKEAQHLAASIGSTRVSVRPSGAPA
jgi:hypothetical protein